MDPHELDRLEYETQHAATWETLQAAAGQRDLVVKMHGGLLAVLTVTGPAVAGHVAGVTLLRVLCWYVAIGALALGFMTENFLRGVQSLRMLQFEMYSANRYSRLVLGTRHRRETYFSHLIDKPEVLPLHQQLDPMGLIVQNVRHYLLADAFLFPVAALAGLGLAAHGSGRVTAFLAGLVCGGLSLTVVRSWTDRAIHKGERDTSVRVVDRYRALGVYPEGSSGS